MSRKWTVITVTFNSESDLRDHWTTDPLDRDFTWVVVDNGSQDGTLEIARARADHVIETGFNAGFGRANNLALKDVSTPYVLFANPDLAVPATGWQEDLAASVDRFGGLVAPQLVNPDGSAQPNARGLPFLTSKIRNRLQKDRTADDPYAPVGLKVATYCSWAMGAAIAATTNQFRQLGGWNPKFFLYYEDHELGMRAWQNELPVVLDPSVQFRHDWRRATKRIRFKPWRAEIASMLKFYAMYPELITPLLGRKRRGRSFQKMLDLLWVSANRDVTAR